MTHYAYDATGENDKTIGHTERRNKMNIYVNALLTILLFLLVTAAVSRNTADALSGRTIPQTATFPTDRSSKQEVWFTASDAAEFPGEPPVDFSTSLHTKRSQPQVPSTDQGNRTTSFVESYFPTPATLKDDVRFWTFIFTELSYYEGVLHDADHADIIFDTLHFSRRRTDDWWAEIASRRRSIEQTLTSAAALPESMWTHEQQAIAALYRKKPGALFGAAHRVRFQGGLKESFHRSIERSAQYMDTITKILNLYDIPPVVAFLPHIESGFRPTARSKVGALGLWQFMPETGKEFMRVDSIIDERLDPIASSIAAARFMHRNYQVLGSWPLVITAYNHGLYGVLNAVEKTGSANLGTIVQEYRSPSFGFASKNFYSSFLAAMNVALNANKYFRDINPREPAPIQSILIQHPVEPSVIANHFGISIEDFRDLNPSLLPSLFDASLPIPKGVSLNLPANIVLAAEKASIWQLPSHHQREHPPKTPYQMVTRGSQIAEQSFTMLPFHFRTNWADSTRTSNHTITLARGSIFSGGHRPWFTPSKPFLEAISTIEDESNKSRVATLQTKNTLHRHKTAGM